VGYVEKRNGKYRARYRDPLWRPHSKTFIRKADQVGVRDGCASALVDARVPDTDHSGMITTLPTFRPVSTYR
jgi:hypothetical protein